MEIIRDCKVLTALNTTPLLSNLRDLLGRGDGKMYKTYTHSHTEQQADIPQTQTHTAHLMGGQTHTERQTYTDSQDSLQAAQIKTHTTDRAEDRGSIK